MLLLAALNRNLSVAFKLQQVLRTAVLVNHRVELVVGVTAAASYRPLTALKLCLSR